MLTNTAGNLISKNDVWTGGKLLQYEMTISSQRTSRGVCPVPPSSPSFGKQVWAIRIDASPITSGVSPLEGIKSARDMITVNYHSLFITEDTIEQFPVAYDCAQSIGFNL